MSVDCMNLFFFPPSLLFFFIAEFRRIGVPRSRASPCQRSEGRSTSRSTPPAPRPWIRQLAATTWCILPYPVTKTQLILLIEGWFRVLNQRFRWLTTKICVYKVSLQFQWFIREANEKADEWKLLQNETYISKFFFFFFLPWYGRY